MILCVPHGIVCQLIFKDEDDQEGAGTACITTFVFEKKYVICPKSLRLNMDEKRKLKYTYIHFRK